MRADVCAFMSARPKPVADFLHNISLANPRTRPASHRAERLPLSRREQKPSWRFAMSA